MFVHEIQELIDGQYLSVKNHKASLTKKGMRLAKKLGVALKAVETCVRYKLPETFAPYAEMFERICKDRPAPLEKYDQGYIRPYDIMLRVHFLYERCDLENCNIFVLGDDDLMSIALALTHMPKHINVVDIDKRIIDFIEKTASKYDLSISATTYDASKDLPPHLREKHDVFITDPVETVSGIKVFLSRAASSLRKNGAGYFGLTHLEASYKKWWKIEKMLHDMNFVITDILRYFSTYPTKNNIGLASANYPLTKHLESMGAGPINTDFFRSSFFRVESINTPKPLITGDVVLKEEMYIDEEALVTSNSAGRC